MSCHTFHIRNIFPMLRSIVFIFMLMPLAAFSTNAFAQTADAARQTLETAVNQILNDIKNPEFSNPATRARIRSRIENEVYKVFDFEEFSQRTVGPRWREFSAEEKRRFSNAFANLLFNTYLNRINGYNGEQVAYTGTVSSPDGKLVEVRTVITMSNGKKTPVFYKMLLKNGQWRVFDVIIENISLVKNYRTQFQSILNTATPDQLTAQVEAKAKEIQAQGTADENRKSN